MSLIRRNPDLAAAALLALVTACFSEVSLSSLRESINFPLLALLFSLMTIVAALRRAEFFSGLFCHLFQKPMNSRRMGQVFLFLSFFTSMVFTNDVSLIIFVPLAISLFKEAHALRLVIPVLTWMTIAANRESINFPLLALLFSLMTIVAALRRAGFFSGLFCHLFQKPMNSRRMGQVFLFLSFFTSMVFTNDVSLIIFVPLAISLFKEAHALRLVILVLTWMTIAANLGSMLTPIGNPQNLFIYAHYHLPLAEFLSITAPITALSAVLLLLASYTLEERPLVLSFAKPTGIPRLRIALLLLLFALCLLNVLRILPISFLLAIVIPACALLDRKAFLEVDYKLLALFLALFIAVGNLTHIPGLQERPAALLAGHEFWISLLLSQVVSNVPATVMLSPYTENYTALLLGVNIGGLGTLIASMASLISFKAYLSMRFHFARAYFLVFTGANLGFLAVLIGAYLVLWGK